MSKASEGEFCYVKLVTEGVREGEVISTGKNYELRLRDSDRVVVAPESSIWTAPELVNDVEERLKA